MKSKYWVFALLLTASVSVHAEIFKCTSANGKTLYQPEPCTKTSQQSVVEVKEMTPEETAQAKERLKMWQDQQAAEEATKAAEEQKRQEALKQQQAQDAQLRSQKQQMPQQQPPSGINRRFGYLPYGN